METQSEAESGVTPTRTSKRTSRAPDKLEPDYSPVCKTPRLESALMGKPVRETASRTSTPPDPAPAPALKLKMFSKMTAKGRNQQAGGAEEEEKGGVQGAGAGGMTITKVRKSSPTPGMISLPGLPTTGPPPPSYSAASRSHPGPQRGLHHAAAVWAEEDHQAGPSNPEPLLHSLPRSDGLPLPLLHGLPLPVSPALRCRAAQPGRQQTSPVLLF